MPTSTKKNGQHTPQTSSIGGLIGHHTSYSAILCLSCYAAIKVMNSTKSISVIHLATIYGKSDVKFMCHIEMRGSHNSAMPTFTRAHSIMI